MSEERREERLPPRRLKPGDKFYRDTVTFEIVENNVVRGYRQPPIYIISYVIRDGDYESDVAHLFLRENDDAREWIDRVMNHYIRNRDYIRRRLRRVAR